MTRARRHTAAVAIAVVLALTGGSGAAAPAGGISIATQPERVATGLGERFSFDTTIANEAAAATGSMIAHLNILSLRDGTYVDPEDWSADRTVYLGALGPGARRTITWDIHAVNTGRLAAYVTVLPQDESVVPPATGTVVRFDVSERDTLNAGGVLPLVLGIPAALALLTAAAHRIRRRRPQATLPTPS